MATITNRNFQAVELPSGHVVPAAQCTWAENTGYVCIMPGVLITSNEVLRSDSAAVLRGPVASGALVVEYDSDPPVSDAAGEDPLAPQKAEFAKAMADASVLAWATAFGTGPVPFDTAMQIMFTPGAMDALLAAQAAEAALVTEAAPAVIEETPVAAEAVIEEPAPAQSRR